MSNRQYSITSIEAQKPNTIKMIVQKFGESSRVQVPSIGIQFENGIIDWSTFGSGSEREMIGYNGTLTVTVSGLDFYFTGDVYKIYIEIFDEDDRQTSKPFTDCILPLRADIKDSFQIQELPTQQTQNVYYNNTYKGTTNSCVANAIASAKEIQSIRKGRPVQGSIGWFWGKTGISESGGTNYGTAFNFLINNGIPPYQVVNKINGVYEYPDVYFYNDAKIISNSTHDISNYALPQKIEKLDTLSPYNGQLQLICDALQNPNYCLILSIVADISIESEQAKNTGIVPSISASGNSNGGHAMIVLGWQTINKRKYWVCKNSWCYKDKTPMGQNGYYFIPFNWGNGTAGVGISKFYVLKDDDNAPALPELPLNLDAFMIDERHANGVVFGCTTVDDATRYRLRWVQKDTTKEIYTYSSDLIKPTFDFDANKLYAQGARWGYTYIVDASAEINSIWSKSNSSVQITLLPLFTYIDYVTTVSSTSLAVKLQKQMNDVGKFTGLRVFRGYKNFTSETSLPCEDYKDIKSYDELAVFDNLKPNSTWAFASRAYLDVDNGNGKTERLWAAFAREDEVVATIGDITPFKWTYLKTKNQNFNLTADEWNGFTARVNLTRVSKGLLTYNFQPAIKGQIFTADHYNSARQAIQAIQGYGTLIPSVKKGDAITAYMMNILVAELNTIK